MRIELVTWFSSITALTIVWFIAISVHSQCLEDQKSLLLQLKHNLQFDPTSSVKLVNWAQGNDCCQWDGVTCDHFGRVKGLDLNTESIFGGLNQSSSLFGLKFLENLNLAYNLFNSTQIPSSFGVLTSLVYLNLSYNDFSGQIPLEFSHLTRLETVDLSGNTLLHGSILDLFPQNRALRNLVLSETSFSGNLPESVGSLRELRRLEIHGCHLSGQIPKSLANLSQLVHLDLSSNNFTGPIPSFQRAKNLTYIDLTENSLTGPVPSTYFEGLSNLEFIALKNNSFNGSIPCSLFSFPSLQTIDLSSNRFSKIAGSLPDDLLSPLVYLDLSSNKLQGPVPAYLFDFQSLISLSLSSNNFSGTVQLESFHRLPNLKWLELSRNKLSVNASIGESILSSFPQLIILGLASCNLQKFPPLMNQSLLLGLDISDNQISGLIPNWLWNVSGGGVNLSCNFLVGFQGKFIIPSVGYLDLHSNQLRGEIPMPTEATNYVDYSKNNFSSSITAEFGNRIATVNFFSLSDNMLYGPIPPSICNGSLLEILNLSNNRFSGTIPECLIHKATTTLRILNLQNNNLVGNIVGTFPKGCILKTLELNGNHLEEEIPKSLANCVDLEVLNLGSNKIKGNFPCFLANLSELHVLVLRSNQFHGNIRCRGVHNFIWPKLQIVDLALNNFNGFLPPKFFSQRKAMMDGNAPNLKHLRFDMYSDNSYYVNSVTVTIKGAEMKLVKILNIFTAVDLSNNRFKGEIPNTLGDLKSLYVLNLSHNALIGSIPSSLGNLSKLESLDLSWNKLSGSIPVTLASLTFLSFLNLSNNQLVGMIPIGPQLQTLPASSYQGNKGLWGAPLTACCKKAEPAPPSLDGTKSSNDEGEINWVYITATLGYVAGFGAIVGPLLYSKRWRQYYYKPVDRAIIQVLYHREQRSRNQRRRNNINQLRRRQHR